MAMTPEQKAKLRRKAQAAFGEMDSELDLMNASDPFAELEEEVEEVQKPKARPKPKPKQPVVSAKEDSLTNAIVKGGGLPVTSTITSTNETGGNMFSVTGDKRLTPEQVKQKQEDFSAEFAVRGVLNSYRNIGNPIEVIEKLGRDQVRREILRDGGEAAVQRFDKQYPE
tara:strand:- start:13 stop:519 length:507 start_codon:yes stop_codon:yes gene_type:complete